MKILRLALRSIVHFKSYTLINMLGLALSLACVIIIFRYVYGEFTVNHFNRNIDRMYITTVENDREPGKVGFSGVYNYNNEKAFVDITKDPAVELSTTYVYFEDEEINVDNKVINTKIVVADSNFFKIYDFPIIEGKAGISDPKSALISKEFAQKLFGSENPIGKDFRHSSGELLTIVGIMGEPATRSSISFDIAISYYLSDHWSRIPETIVLLYPNVDYQEFNKKYENFFEMKYWETNMRYQIYPLAKLYFCKDIAYAYNHQQGNYTYTIILLVVGILILLVGIVNYVNIYTVLILRRGREFGMKKVFGAQGGKIFIQLVAENTVMIGMVVIIALILAELTNPYLINYLGIEQVSSLSFNILLFAGLIILLPLLVSIYPYLKYNYSKPVTSLKGVGKTGSNHLSRKLFLSFQYTITIAMIILSLLFVKQLHYMLDADLGFRTKDIIQTQFKKSSSDYSIRVSEEEWKANREKEKRMAEEITQKMNESPLFSAWTYGDSPHSESVFLTNLSTADGKSNKIQLLGTSQAWLKIFDIQLVDGRMWNDETESGHGYDFIVTESALKLFGITDFHNATLQPDRRLWWSSDRPQEEMKTNPPYRIVGVIKDFNATHLAHKPVPVVMYYSKGWYEEPLLASIVTGRKQEAIDFLQKLHSETIGGEFTYSFIEDNMAKMYKEDKKIAVIYTVFTIIAIIISALGLLSMSLFDIQQRRREVAVRKVNGASFKGVFILLMKRYFILLFISFIIAVPLSLYAGKSYLEGFAYQTPISWWIFVSALIITAFISFITLIYQIRRAANSNPAEVLKSE